MRLKVAELPLQSYELRSYEILQYVCITTIDSNVMDSYEAAVSSVGGVAAVCVCVCVCLCELYVCDTTLYLLSDCVVYGKGV